MSTDGMHGRVVVEAIAWRDVLASWLVHKGLRLASRKTRHDITEQLATERAAKQLRIRVRNLPTTLAPSPVASPAVIRRTDLGDEPPVVRYPGRGGE